MIEIEQHMESDRYFYTVKNERFWYIADAVNRASDFDTEITLLGYNKKRVSTAITPDCPVTTGNELLGKLFIMTD